MTYQVINNFYYYILYFTSFFLAEGLSIWGQYFTLPFKNLAYWETIKMALPFAWINWFFRTVAINIGDTYKLVTPTQDIFLLIISQFSFVLIINYYYLKQNIYLSDIIAFLLIIFAYYISLFHSVSRFFNISIPKKIESETKTKTETETKTETKTKTEIKTKT